MERTNNVTEIEMENYLYSTVDTVALKKPSLIYEKYVM